MASKVEICNQALAWLGAGIEIQDVEAENTQEARACRTFYDTALDKTLSDAPWQFARTFQDLGLVEANPTEEWAYSYRVPVDSVYVRRIRSGTRRDTESTVIPFAIGQDDDGALLYTDADTCPVEYTRRVTDPNKWPATFRLALAALLARYIAPRIATGDATGVVQRVDRIYAEELSKCLEIVRSEGQLDPLPMSKFERARA